MKERRKPTSTLFNARNNLASELFRACVEGRVKDIKQIKPKFMRACSEYDSRILEDERIKQEKEAKKLARINKKKNKKGNDNGNSNTKTTSI